MTNAETRALVERVRSRWPGTLQQGLIAADIEALCRIAEASLPRTNFPDDQMARHIDFLVQNGVILDTPIARAGVAYFLQNCDPELIKGFTLGGQP